MSCKTTTDFEQDWHSSRHRKQDRHTWFVQVILLLQHKIHPYIHWRTSHSSWPPPLIGCLVFNVKTWKVFKSTEEFKAGCSLKPQDPPLSFFCCFKPSVYHNHLTCERDSIVKFVVLVYSLTPKPMGVQIWLWGQRSNTVLTTHEMYLDSEMERNS